MTSRPAHYDVAIIGAGMSGLAAGIRLAHFGKKVCILERHSVWGGLNSFYKKGGHHFDTGLHAMTNWLAPGYRGPRIPLQRIYRQLRLSPELFQLEPQGYSQVVFGDARLRFENGLERLTDEVRRVFPAEVDGFLRLARDVEPYPEANLDRPFVSTRARLSEYLAEPLLREMLLAPLLWYGSAHEGDVDFEQFQILFNSIYREGFCRPREGVKTIIFALVRRYEETGGVLRRRAGVSRLRVEDGRVKGLELDDGGHVTADQVLSSAGWVETARLRSDQSAEALAEDEGQLAFTEAIHVLDRPMRALGFDACITFYNQGPSFEWRSPRAALVDLQSSVICVPDNFAHTEPLTDHRVRVTHLAHNRRWFELDSETYAREKARMIEDSVRTTARVTGDFRSHITYSDAFTPRTVTKYTGHVNGAIYGSPNKRKTGRTDLSNLYIMGTDQGMLGIVGAMLSGIAVANTAAAG